VINAQRKEQGLTIKDVVRIVIASSNPEIATVVEKYNKELIHSTLASVVQMGGGEGGVEAKIGADKIIFRLIV